MADNFPLTPGSGRNAATDQVTFSGDTADVQLIKQVHVIGSEGSKTVVELVRAEDTGSNAGDPGIPILGVRNDADADFVGTDLDYVMQAFTSDGKAKVQASRDLQRISVQSAGLTIATTAYTAGDQVGTQFTFTGAARKSGGGGVIVGVLLISAADIIGAYDLLVTDSTITLAGDNAVYAISDADALKIVGLIQLTGAYDIGNNRICQAYNLAVPYICSGGTSLFASLITRAAHTFFAAVTDLQVILLVERNN